MNKFCDLHIHSDFSDGTLRPSELIDLARQQNLAAVALCDHNTVDGVPEFQAAAADTDVEAIAGIEFSTDYRGSELHILGLFIPEGRFVEIRSFLAPLSIRKEQSNRALLEALDRAGIHLSYEAVQAHTRGGRVNRAHVAAEMVRLGYAASVREAFSQWLDLRRGYYRPPNNPDALEMIRYIKEMGAVAVWAHPYLSLEPEEVREFLPQAAACDLDGMETLYPRYDAATTALARAAAREFGLLESGGSDFHGGNKPDIRMGVGTGDLAVPIELLEALRERKATQG